MRIGIYNPYLATLGGGENLLACLAEALEAARPDATIDLIAHADGVGPAELMRRFGVALERTRVRVVPSPATRWDRHLGRLEVARRWVHDRMLGAETAPYDLFINLTIFSTMPARARRSVYWCMFPLATAPVAVPWSHWSFGPRWLNVALRRHYFHRMARSYSKVVAISEFTRGWTRAYWGVDAEVLYPPVQTRPALDLSRKGRHILAVGRFFPGNHNKKHATMIEAFRRLIDEGLTGWTLHLAGSLTDVEGTRAYVEALRARADGYPIQFHLDASPAALEDLYRTAALFWHATGHGEAPDAEPEKMEHFGLTTVEAMTWGAVPLVIDRGGQPEIVTHGETGFLWRTLDELVALTKGLAQDEAARARLAERAHQRSLDFGRDAFRARVGRLLDELAAEPAADAL